MDQFVGFLCLSFLLSTFGIGPTTGTSSSSSYRLETADEVSQRGLSPGCNWLPVPLSSNTTTPTSASTQLNCELRKLPVDFLNYSLTTQQLHSTTSVSIQCNDQLLFESFLSPRQSIFTLKNLQSIKIRACKIRKIPKKTYIGVGTSLKTLILQTLNGDWSSSYGLQIEEGGFDGLVRLENLDLSQNNLWSLPLDVFCPLGQNLQYLNLSNNRLGFGDNDSPFSSEDSSTSRSPDCSLALQNLDLSGNGLRRVGRGGFGRLKRLGELRLQNNQIEVIEDGAFYQLTGLKLLNLSTNRLVALPLSLFNGNPGLRELHLQNNSITALSPSVFSALDQLLLLDLSHNSLGSNTVKENLFSGLLRLIILKLSFNQLSFIDSGTFANLMSLQSLHLDNNKIENIHSEAFGALSNLHLLDLSRNRLQSVDGRLLANLFVLRQLYLDHNKIRRIDDTALVNVTSLKDLGLAGNLLTEVPVALRLGPHHGLGSIETLDLGENRIAGVTNESFLGLGQVYGLRLVDNRIAELPNGFCTSLKKLHVLNLAQNRISKIGPTAFTGCPRLRALRLDTNNLEELPMSLTPQLPSLLWFNVSENRIRWADYHLLPPTIEWLDLSYNSLVTLGGLVSSGSGKSSAANPIQYHLRVLDASHNNLTTLDYTTIPPTLETLRLNSNSLKSVAMDTFSRAGRLRRVELMGNQIESLPLGAIKIPTVEIDKSLPEIYLGGNSFMCDCSMEWLTRVNQLTLLRQHPRIVDLDAVMCRSLSSRSQELISLADTKPSQFTCPYTTHCFALCQCCEFDACDCQMSCPNNCTCFHDSSWSTNIVDCSKSEHDEIPQRIPMDATELYLDGNKIPTLGSHVFIGKKNLRVLYLNGSRVEIIRNKTFNGLKSLEILRLDDNRLSEISGFEFADLDNLVELYLEHNFLQWISPSAFSHLKFLQLLRLDGNQLLDFPVWELRSPYLRSLTLSGNPWSCDCEFIIPFRSWINSKLSIVVDMSLTKCSPSGVNRLESKVPQSIGSLCSSSNSEDISHNYSEVENTNHILSDGGGVSAIHHPQETEDGEVTVVNKSNDFLSLWILTLALLGILGVIVVLALLIFRKELNLCSLIDRLRLRRRRATEKVSDSNIFFASSGGTGIGGTAVVEDGDKLFDAYFLYSRRDEEIVLQKLVPELEHGLRLLLHYRDLSESWSSEMTLSAGESSRRIVILLSQSFLQVELSNSESRATLSTLMQRYRDKILFMLLPPLNEGGIGVLYPELRNGNNILEWLDPNFWPKLRILLPTARVTYSNNSNHHHHPDSIYNQSIGSNSTSTYHRNILPYSIQRNTGTATLGRNNSLPIVPKHHIVLPVPNWHQQTNQEPTYFSFAEKFRYHQQQQPLTFATMQSTPSTHKVKQGTKTLNHPYRPLLLRHGPQPPPDQLISPQSQSSTGDSGNVNGSSSSSDELENEHVYSTLDSPLQSPSENFCVHTQPGENRTMYFV